jgi:bifunctional DNA-binding transcriptional regulator/antitoxin component of YhaV-PrlF toxin-antitoxin module
MIATTKIYNKYQTVIPAEIRKKLNIDKTYVIEWDLDENNEVKLNFRKKTKPEDIIGMISTENPTDAVELKKKHQRGEKIDFD